jgi:CDP-paratose 2-epimerase
MRIFITGGAGFIGVNSADYFLKQGHQVIIFDNLSRIGGKANLEWLRGRHQEGLRFIFGDIRNFENLSNSVQGADVIIHLASQVAVTTSVADPREDFEINALGTLNILEAVRHKCPDATVLYASTNKVYGGMEGVRLVEEETRHTYADFVNGIPENFPLDFHSPYGCSKGAGDQYSIDYARIYGLKTLVLRQSCIYGPRQFGVEDQGWVAHFIIAAYLGRPITIYGDGKQVRDLLHINDLIRAYELGIQHIDTVKGQAINLGGGPANTLSVWSEFGPMLQDMIGHRIEVNFEDWRPGDQKVFVANVRRAKARLGWEPTINPTDGIKELHTWIIRNSDSIKGFDL